MTYIEDATAGSCTPSSVLIDVENRKFVYLSKTIDKANFWIKDQKRPSIDIPNKTVIVNGMVKTGNSSVKRISISVS